MKLHEYISGRLLALILLLFLFALEADCVSFSCQLRTTKTLVQTLIWLREKSLTLTDEILEEILLHQCEISSSPHASESIRPLDWLQTPQINKSAAN